MYSVIDSYRNEATLFEGGVCFVTVFNGSATVRGNTDKQGFRAYDYGIVEESHTVPRSPAGSEGCTYIFVNLSPFTNLS